MKTSPNGRKFIQGFEGTILQAYDDYNDKVVPVGGTVHGVLTIGTGHTSAAGLPNVVPGMTITLAEADQILAADLVRVEGEVLRYINVPLNQNQFDALVSFQFNTGWLGHTGCSLRNALNAGNYNLAASDFMLYDRASGRELPGLRRRRLAERALFLTPVSLSLNPAMEPSS